tara:strand:- start:1515 stop:2123 length:609 start_codon:yes stop_codon:yes gene_type:complete
MLVARLFLISPLWVAYFFHETHMGPMHEEMSFSTLLIISVVAYLVLSWWDSGRAPRSAISIIMRNMALTYCVVWSFLLLFGAGYFFWYMISHATLWVILFWQWVAHTIAHHLIYPYADPNYCDLRKAGWHPFWDTTIYNHDSELIKDGGFEEPIYEGFVPPAHWRFQCPVCGARQQTNFGVCWNCNYGEDGDESAYYERWGN